jgi:hypothetical protein
MTSVPEHPQAERPGPRVGQIVAGATITLIGVGWFLEVAEIADVPWGAFLPAMLMVVGGALVVGARSGPQSGLVVLGIIITIAVVLSSVAEVVLDVPFGGGVGEKEHVVTGEVADEYRWGIGKMVVDLRGGSGSGTVEISVAIGELIVIVPEGVAVEAEAGIGEVVVFGERSSGIDPGLEAGSGTLLVDANVGLGKVEVRR